MNCAIEVLGEDLLLMELLESIHASFHLEEIPERPSWYNEYTDDLGAANYWEGIEETDWIWGRDWLEVSWEDLDSHDAVFSFLPDFAKPYYVGAAMSVAIKEGMKVPYSLESFLTLLAVPLPKDGKQTGFSIIVRELLSVFSEEQKAVLMHFVMQCVDAGISETDLERIRSKLQ